MKSTIAAALVSIASLGACAALAQSWPLKPVQLIFPWPPGGADALPRALAERVSQVLGQALVFENRPGAGGTIGLAAVARAAPDGYTLAITDITSHAISGSLYKKLSYEVVKDFAPVAIAARTPVALAVIPGIGVKTFQELVALARSQPGRLNFASSGNGAITHLALERLKRMAGLELVHVPYNGSAAAVASLLAGTTVGTFASLPSVVSNARAGKLVLLGVSFTRPIPQLPDLPPIAQHLPGFDMGLYQGVLAPAATPRAVIDRVHAAVERALDDERVKVVMQRAMFEPVRMSPEQFGAFIQSEAKSWGALVNSLGLTLD
ncbi:MAG: tripartite tricarboxylate transporter substrate binding protein [Burkholderiales bacterium]|nr:tripartite tricarboxylate transporter substrate binding protein [Burkholderiales bacterium]